MADMKRRKMESRPVVDPIRKGEPKITERTLPDTPKISAPNYAEGPLAKLMEGLKTLTPTIQKYGATKYQEDFDEGARKKTEGVPLEADAYGGEVRGYEYMDGQYKAVVFEQNATEFVNNYGHLKPNEFWSRYKQLRDEAFGGVIHEEQMRAFLPHSMKVEEMLEKKYGEAQQKIYEAEKFEKTGAIIKGESEFEILDTLKPYGVNQLADLSKPSVYRNVVNNSPNFGPGIGKKFREYLNKKQIEWGNPDGLNMKRQEITDRQFNYMKHLAITHGMPELLEYVNEPDATGNRVITMKSASGQSYSDMYREAKNAAENTRDELLKGFAQQEKAAVEKMKDDNAFRLLEKKYNLDPTDVVGANALVQEVMALGEGGLKFTFAKDLVDDMKKVKDSGGFPDDQADRGYFNRALQEFIGGRYDYQDLIRDSRMKRLSLTNQKYLYGLMKEKYNSGEKQPYVDEDFHLRDVRNALEDWANPTKGNLLASVDIAGQGKNFANSCIDGLMEGYRVLRDEKKRPLTRQELNAIKEDVMKNQMAYRTEIVKKLEANMKQKGLMKEQINWGDPASVERYTKGMLERMRSSNNPQTAPIVPDRPKATLPPP
jgi:hypothetical protein